MEGPKVADGGKKRLVRKFSRGCSIRMASVLLFLFLSLSLFSTVIFGSLTSLSSFILFAGDTPPVWHSMTDEELIQRASSMPWDVPGARKVAFMFLTRERIPLRLLWERFFAGHDGLFSIYVHTSPEFKEEPPEDSIFYKRRIPSKVSAVHDLVN